MKQRRVGKGIAAWLMSLAMVMTIINLPAFTMEVKADEITVEVNGINYELNDSNNTAIVVEKEPGYAGDIIIPGTVSYNGNEYTVTEIDFAAFADCDSLLTVTVPSTVVKIGMNAFCYCSNLTSVTIPSGVEIIEEDIFVGCSNLSTITIPDSVTRIGARAFKDCSSLSSITIPNNVTYIGANAFARCSSLTGITIPTSVTYIGTNSFEGCNDLVISFDCSPYLSSFNNWGNYKSINKNHHGGTATCISMAICEGCGDEYGAIDAGNHIFSSDCDAICDGCGYERVATGIHDFDAQPYQTDDTGKHYQKCKACGADSDHVTCTPGTAVKEDVVAPTCSDNGSHNDVVYCTVCNQKLSTTPATDLATGNHDFHDQDGMNDPSIEACASCGVKNFNFSGLDSSVVAVDKEYTGSGINPEVTITGLTQDTDYTVEDVTKTEPGEYEIKVTGKGDYAGERIVSWKIIPGEPTLIIPTPVAQYKQKLSDVEIVNPEGNVEGTWNWKNPNEVVTAIGESTFVAIFTPADTTKWNVVEKDIIVNVNKASYAPSEEYSKTFIYSGEYIDEIIDLSQFVAEDAGKASYAIADKTFTGTDTVTEAVIDGNNLKFSLAKMDAYAENTSTTISVTVSTANYQDYTKIIKITRSNCDHPEDMIGLEHVILPGCETIGEDIKKCTKCNEVIESGIVVQALGHDYIDGVCSRCGVISLELCKDINVDVTSVLYNETAQTPEVKVTYKGTELVEGTDYVLSVDSETVIGTYELIIEGTGDYRDTIKKNWSVLPAKGLYCAAIPDQVYTGKAIKPKMDVYSDGVLLTVGKDYTITYGKYNTNVATKDAVSKGKNVAPSVTITGKGNYSDKKVLTFNIVPCSIDTAAVNNIVVAKTKSAIKINPVVTFDGKKLKLGTDYVVSTTTSADDAVTSYTEANVYNLYVVGKNNYSGAIPFTFTITGKTLANKVTVAKIENQKYDGGNQVKPVPSITYKIGGKSTDVSSHFDVTYDNNTEIGTATVIITAKDSSEMFAGSKTITFKIVGKSIAGAKLGTDGKEKIPVAVYNGNAYEPELNLYVGDDKLTKNVDYIVTYAKNVNIGTATATVVGKGKYTGSKKFTYKISKYDATTDSSSLIKVNGADASVVDISVNYEKGGVLPKPVVTFGGNELKEKVDYTLSYANNKVVAAKDAMKSGKSIAPTMTITFKGNLSGKKTVKFTITNKDIKEGKITVADKAVSTKANAWKQTAVTIVDTNGKKLVAGTDYSKTFKYFYDPGCTSEITAETLAADTQVFVKVYGIKNYDGTDIVGSYRISKINLSKVSASIDPQTYTGKEICPEASDIKVWVGSGKTKTYLSAGTDYIVVSGSYTKNTNKGTATVTIIGKGDYYGTKVVKYTIGAKKFLWWEL